MSTIRSDIATIDREGKKRRTQLTFSAEVLEVIDALRDDDEVRSRFVERAIWAWLVDEHSLATVLSEIARQQQQLEPDEKLDDPKEYELPV